jgi:anti-sigma-K factor RskA
MQDQEFDPAAYALDALTEQERAAYERRLASDPALAEATRAATETAAALGLAAAQTPPPSLKGNVLAAIRSTPQESPPAPQQHADAAPHPGDAGGATPTSGTPASAGPAPEGAVAASRPRDRRWRTVWALAASALLVAAAALGGVLVSEQRQQAELRDQVTALQDQTEQMRQLLQADDVRSATAQTPDGDPVVLVYSADRGLMTVSGQDLPAAPAGRAYELWLISGSGAVPAGFLPAGDVAVIEDSMEGVTHLGITIEPAEGSDQPTTDPIVLQQL